MPLGCMQFLIIMVYFAKLLFRKFVPFYHSLIGLYIFKNIWLLAFCLFLWMVYFTHFLAGRFSYYFEFFKTLMSLDLCIFYKYFSQFAMHFYFVYAIFMCRSFIFLFIQIYYFVLCGFLTVLLCLARSSPPLTLEENSCVFICVFFF